MSGIYFVAGLDLYSYSFLNNHGCSITDYFLGGS